MQLLLKNTPNAGYKRDDVVAIVDDGHKWAAGELDTNHFTIVKNVELTDSEKQLLLMPDYQLKIPKSALRVPGLLKHLINNKNLEEAGRRRYNAPGGIMKRK